MRVSIASAPWRLASALLATVVLATPACSDGDGAGGSGGSGATGAGYTATAGAPAGGGGSGASGAAGATGGGGSGASGAGTTSGGGGAGTGGGTAGATPEWGQLGGACGEIDDFEIASPSPFVFTNEIDFGTQNWDYDLLSPGGKQVFDDDNAGGSSLYSEVLAFEVLHRCELAELLKTETFIEYDDSATTITDILVSIDGHKVGVSVVRAFRYPPGTPYPLSEALTKLEEKLLGIQQSSAHVLPVDEWSKQILHVIAWDPTDAATVVTALDQIDASVKADTIVVVTATNGTDEYLYVNQTP